MKLIFCLSHGMAILHSNFHPMEKSTRLAMLQYPDAHMKKKFLKLAKRQAKQTPKTIGRIVECIQDQEERGLKRHK